MRQPGVGLLRLHRRTRVELGWLIVEQRLVDSKGEDVVQIVRQIGVVCVDWSRVVDDVILGGPRLISRNV